jgi:type VI secretion system protein ImpC
MAKPISFEEFDFKTVASMDETRSKPAPEIPFRICILGDFSGRANRGICEPASALTVHHPTQIDRDNIEAVMEKLGVEVHLPLAGPSQPPVALQFSELDDFHPEQLYARLDVFKALRNTRKRLTDARTFESARKEIQGWSGAAPASEDTGQAPVQSLPKSPVPTQPSGNILDRIVEEADGRMPDAGTVAGPSDWDLFLQKIVGPHLVPGDDPEQEGLVAAVDASISGLMEAILHHPVFQTIEAAWRALRFLLYRVETDEKLKVYLLDISKDELGADLNGSDDLQKTGIYRLFVEQAVGTPGGEPWAVIAGNYTFDQTREDVEILGRLAIVARLAGAPFIAGVHDHVLGCESLADTLDPDDWKRPIDPEDSRVWKVLRNIPEAPYLGLALPRFLLRLPYGKETDPVDCFDFEEMSGPPLHDHYLWGNPVFACTLLLARAFSRNGWTLRPGMMQDIEGLPLHIHSEQGETLVTPCAEVVFSERAMERALGLGLMVLLSFKDRDIVRLARFQSIADPLTQLAGPWQS